MALYDKTGELHASQAGNVDSVTLMSTDTERITNGMRFVHETWATAVEATLAVFLLWRQVGVVAVAPVIIALGIFCTIPL